MFDIKTWKQGIESWLENKVEVAFWGALIAFVLAMLAFALQIIVFSIYIKRKRKERKKRRAERENRLCYTLPDKQNSFLRDRLNSVLKTPDLTTDLANPVEADGVCLDYTMEMIDKALNAPLSFADRLSIEETAKLFKVICMRMEWSEKDVKTMNDCCLSTLKILAKYAV